MADQSVTQASQTQQQQQAAQGKPLPVACYRPCRHSPAVDKMPERSFTVVFQIIGTPRIFAQTGGGTKLLGTPLELFKTREFLVNNVRADVHNTFPIAIGMAFPFSEQSTFIGEDGTALPSAIVGPSYQTYCYIGPRIPDFVMTRAELQKRIVRNGNTVHVDSKIAHYIKLNAKFLASLGVNVPDMSDDESDGDDDDDDEHEHKHRHDTKEKSHAGMHEIPVAVADVIERELLKKIDAYERYSKVEIRTAPLSVDFSPLMPWRTFVDNCMKGNYGPAGEALVDTPGVISVHLYYTILDAQVDSPAPSASASSSSSSCKATL
jgi:hypothetical protein